ncbi:DNA topoisomerase 1 [Pichia californica]|uniref:DNA topoisomerase I n=1 Tax=Pichia californica TaxID=460514 RepID=A0A9P7BEQ7_9ASCO|nr:DNA topoisomerase 1 [[Candida] californica]KAG0689612.1 DNA topoisomerase 1 [[Candida] californica]
MTDQKLKKEKSDSINSVKRKSKTDDESGSKKKIKIEKDNVSNKKLKKSIPIKKEITTTKVKKEKIKKESTPNSDDNEEEEEEDDTFKWWENPDDLDGEVKWETLEHSGVIFPPEYEPLPKNVKLYYDGKPVTLPIEAEEVAGFFGALLESEHAKNPVFQKNFFKDFQNVLKDSGGCPETDINSFEKCDFSKIFQYYDKKREEKKSLPASEKKLIKEEKEKLEEKYKYCLLDGRKEQVGNFRIEPPGLFRGRGAHPKTGALKRRVQPEDITLNLGKDAPIPTPPNGHNWGEVRHDNTVAWLAMWKENIMGNVKYVRFSQNSSFKGISDLKKFEKARELKKHIDKIRADYRSKLKSNLMIDRQIATATYLIDVFALRAGGEKRDDEADTVGCCSLRFEHIFLKPPNIVIFDFLGKDSIRFYQEVQVDQQAFKNMKIFKKDPKKPGDDLFDRLDPSILNKYFQEFMTGLTAKVFRTYNASKTMQDQIDSIVNEGTVNEKVVAFNAANREVAILCNHQRTIPKAHQAGVQKINEKIEEMIWQKIKLKRIMLQMDKTMKKKDMAFFEETSDLTKEKELEIVTRWSERELEKVQKKFEKDKEKLKFEKKSISTEEYKKKTEEIKEEHKKKVDKTKEMIKQFKSEARKQKYEEKSTYTAEKLKAQVDKLDERIKNTSLQLKDKEENSAVSLGTSKMNYIDPRLTVMFAKKFDVPIEKLFTKTLREKFAWAIESADADWRF